MKDNFRYIVAGILIFLIIILQPTYLKWLGYDVDTTQQSVEGGVVPTPSLMGAPSAGANETEKVDPGIASIKNNIPEQNITISTPLYTATISNRAGEARPSINTSIIWICKIMYYIDLRFSLYGLAK